MPVVLDFALNVQYGNFFYFLPLVLTVLFTVIGSILCVKLGQKFTKILVSVTLWISFAIHFLMVFTPYYWQGVPDSAVVIALPNVCAVYVVIAPFVFHFGNAYWKDYLYYGGVLAGLLAMVVFPTPIVSAESTKTFADTTYLIETIRYYLVHALIVFAPVWMLVGKVHTLNYRRLWAVPLMFTALLTVTVLNGMFFGMVVKHPWFPHEFIGPDGLFNRYGPHNGTANQSMAYGPGPDKDAALSWLYPYTIPYLQTYYYGDQLLFVPVIWVMPYLYLGVALMGIPLALPFDYRRIGGDFASFGRKVGSLFRKKEKE
ncbi:MAG: hypothetical protein K6E59_00640 [Bacilli bacterium]|nr:hypothetical protein [Bacilli bacterium]